MSCCQHNVSKIRCTTALGAYDRALGAECLLPLPVKSMTTAGSLDSPEIHADGRVPLSGGTTGV